MNSESLDTFFSTYLLFPQQFSELGVNFIVNVAHSSFETVEAASGRF